MHVGRTPFLNPPQSELALLRNVVDIPGRLSRTRFILCHMGKYFNPSPGGFESLKDCDNVWLDSSGVGKGNICEGLEQLGPERIVVGSDWPYGDPMKSLSIVSAAAHQYAASMKLVGEDVLRRIVYGNAGRLLGIPISHR